MSILILADHDNEALSPHTLNVVKASQSIGGNIDIVVCGNGSQKVAEQASKIAGIGTVFHADHEALGHGLAENIVPVLKTLTQNKGYTYVLTSAGTTGKNIFPRLAALLDVQQISDITAVIDGSTFERPIYAGNAIATVQSSDTIKVITVRPTAFDAVSDTESGSASIEEIQAGSGFEGVTFVSRALSESDRPDLGTADVVISGGRGLGSGENFVLLERLADKLNAAIGASRAAVDAGFVPNDYQVGQTGKVVAPQLYIAVGISGAIQHIAGMKGSKTIVAINKDPDAPIFQVADYGLVGDLFDLVPELTEKL